MSEKEFALYKELFDEYLTIQQSLLRMSNIIHSNLANEIKIVETEMEEIREDRQEAMAAFENFNQKANQLFNILSAVLKSIREMSASVTRNIL